jgi:histidine triad (HIT) family protein
VLPVSHEPSGYRCPFCALLRADFDERNLPSDVVAVTERAMVRIAPKWWPHNPGAALVIPRVHVENLYDLTAEDGRALWELTQQTAVALRTAYGCEGTSIRQHNEPAGGQDVWHLHVHVFPRWSGDDLYRRDAEASWASVGERERYALRLRAQLGLPFSVEDPPAW